MQKISVQAGEGLEKLQLSEAISQTPGPLEVQVRWRATSLNYHDYLVAKGGIPVPAGRIPMSDGAGEIVAIGSEVSHWEVGDRVMSLFFPNWLYGRPTGSNTRTISGETRDGFLRSFCCLPEDQLTAIPENYSFAEAATLPCAALTAWRALVVEGEVKSGDTVLIEGTGGMCIFALQLALAAGATVYATTSSNDKIDRLLSLGAKAVVNYKEDLNWGKTIYKITKGGVDHVIDAGGGATMRQSIEAVKIYGNIFSIGILGGPKGEILFPKLFFKQIHLTGLAVGSAEMQRDMVRAINSTGMRPVIDRTFNGLSAITKAFEYQESGQHFGKIVIEW